MANTVIIPKKFLPSNSDKAMEFIFDYFNGFDIEFAETTDSFHVSLKANQYTYCEDISRGLKFLGITEEEISTYCPVVRNTALCLSENWLPYALLKLQQHIDSMSDELTIIHVDDHQDLMPPFISIQNDSFFDMISGKKIILGDIASLSEAVQSGAITIGSMLSTIIYPIKRSNVIHVKQGAEQSLYALSKETFHDTMLPYCGDRIFITKKDYSDNDQFYFSTDNWEEAEKRVPSNTTCILHIDMDYFNNRYNASTDWKNNPRRLDTPFLQQKMLMDDLVDAVSRIHRRSQIIFLLLGISPSFYPVEFWEDGLTYLLTQLKSIGVGVGVDILKNN